MLFEIDQSVASLFGSGNVGFQAIQAIDYLGLGVAEGNHRLGGSRRILLELAAHPQIHARTRQVLERAAGRATQEGALLHRLSVYGRIVETQNGRLISSHEGSRRVITFPLRWFDSSAKVQPTVILGENLSDARVFLKFGEVGSILAGWGYLPLRYSLDHGGGSAITQVLDDHSTTQRFCWCAVDSDRACPTGSLGNTAASVQPFKDSARHSLIEILETTGRDLENALPDAFYRMTYGTHSQHGALASLFEHLTNVGEVDLRAHVDVEKGVVARQVLGHAVGSPEHTFWQLKLPMLLNHLGIPVASLPCLSTGSCARQAAGAACTCVVVSGNTSNILEHFHDSFGRTSGFSLTKQLDNSVRPEWLRLGSSVASWCCGDDRLRV